MGKGIGGRDVDILPRILRILPDYETLDNLLDTQRAAKVIGLAPATLESDRVSARKLKIGYVKVGVKVLYPKTELARYLIRNAHGIDWGDGDGRERE